MSDIVTNAHGLTHRVERWGRAGYAVRCWDDPDARTYFICDDDGARGSVVAWTPFDLYRLHVDGCDDYCDECERFEGTVWSAAADAGWDAEADQEFSDWALKATLPEIISHAQTVYRARIRAS
jgi:hypothetical protein